MGALAAEPVFLGTLSLSCKLPSIHPQVGAGCPVQMSFQTYQLRTLEDVLDVRARDRRPKLPPPVAQSCRAGAGVEREAEARPEA
jgi:hypothetical protein